MTKIYENRAKYEQYMRLTASPATGKRYGRVLQKFFKIFPEKKYAQDFFRMDIEDYKLIQLRKGVSARTINYEITVVRCFWKYLMERDPDVVYNPALNGKRLKEPYQPPKAVRPEVVAALISEAKSTLDKLLLFLGITSGMRVKEMAALEWSNIDFERGQIVVTADASKGQRGRHLPVRPDVVELLRGLRDSGSATPFGTTSPRTLQARWSRLLHRAGYSGIGLHSLRHTFATQMLRAGVDLRTVQELLGHKNTKTTSMYLTPADSESVREHLQHLPLMPSASPQEPS